jgi:hypothetical protein
VEDWLQDFSPRNGQSPVRIPLLLDALNENANPGALLQQINALAVRTAAFPWFKIVFSSRPEAWKVMRRQVRLAEQRYYRQPNRSEMGIELETFLFGVELYSFSREELPLAYENYLKTYNLQTSYTELSTELRRILKTPLTLKLVASTYHDRAIPTTVQPGEIYRRYVDQMVSEGRLRGIELTFLEDELMPLLISENHYSNVLTSHQVNLALTPSSIPLCGLIMRDELLPGGQYANQSYRNLVDVGILSRQEVDQDYQIAFKYERFYAYYAGRRLFNLSKTQSNQRAFFQQLIELTFSKPFLWGAVKNALVLQTLEQGPGLLLELCFKELFRRLCHYMDPAGDYPLLQMEADLKAALQVNDLLTDTVVSYVLTAHLAADPEAFLPFLASYYEQIDKLEHPTFYYYNVIDYR